VAERGGLENRLHAARSVPFNPVWSQECTISGPSRCCFVPSVRYGFVWSGTTAGTTTAFAAVAEPDNEDIVDSLAHRKARPPPLDDSDRVVVNEHSPRISLPPPPQTAHRFGRGNAPLLSRRRFELLTDGGGETLQSSSGGCRHHFLEQSRNCRPGFSAITVWVSWSTAHVADIMGRDPLFYPTLFSNSLITLHPIGLLDSEKLSCRRQFSGECFTALAASNAKVARLLLRLAIVCDDLVEPEPLVRVFDRLDIGERFRPFVGGRNRAFHLVEASRHARFSLTASLP